MGSVVNFVCFPQISGSFYFKLVFLGNRPGPKEFWDSVRSQMPDISNTASRPCADPCLETNRTTKFLARVDALKASLNILTFQPLLTFEIIRPTFVDIATNVATVSVNAFEARKTFVDIGTFVDVHTGKRPLSVNAVEAV